jgi:hypothetical protein
MAKQLGKFKGDTPRLITDDVGKMTVSINVDPEYRFILQNLMQEARRVDKQEKSKLVVTVQEYKNVRSVEQNAMLWALLEVMATHMNGGRTGGITAWDCYLDMLERFGGKFEYFECVPEAIPTFKEMFRHIKIIEERRGGRTVMCKAYVGSSKYDTGEMTQLIEGVLDVLAENGIDNSEVAYQREEFYSSQRVRHSTGGKEKGVGA